MRHRRTVVYGHESFYVDWDGFVDRVDPEAPTLSGGALTSQLSPVNLLGMLTPGSMNDAETAYEGTAASMQGRRWTGPLSVLLVPRGRRGHR